MYSPQSTSWGMDDMGGGPSKAAAAEDDNDDWEDEGGWGGDGEDGAERCVRAHVMCCIEEVCCTWSTHAPVFLAGNAMQFLTIDALV